MHDVMQKQIVEPRKEDRMNADVLTTSVADGIAVITLGSAKRIYFDEEMATRSPRRWTNSRVTLTFASSS